MASPGSAAKKRLEVFRVVQPARLVCDAGRWRCYSTYSKYMKRSIRRAYLKPIA